MGMEVNTISRVPDNNNNVVSEREDWAVLQRIRERFKGVDPEELEEDIEKAVAEVRSSLMKGGTIARCAECKHWRKIRDGDHDFRPFYEDAHNPRKYTWPGPHGECGKLSDISFDTEPAWIHGQYFIPDLSLMTMPDFGCVLFEERTSEGKPIRCRIQYHI